MNTKRLKLAIATGMASMFVANAAIADGDSRIHLPKSESSVTEDHADIWFAAATDADGYVVDLVGFADGIKCKGATAPAGDAAATTPTAAEVTFEKKMYIPAGDPSLDCGSETVVTLGQTGDIAANLHICKWTTPVLANGNYMLGINTYKFGTASGSELRLSGCEAIAAVTDGVATNVHIPMTYVGPAQKFYQSFSIAVPDGGGTDITQKPSKVQPLLPAWGGTITKGQTTTGKGTPVTNAQVVLEFRDPSPAAGKADWYEVWINDKTGARVEDYDANLQWDNWYKIAVDASELTCNVNADNTRTCSIDVRNSAKIGAATLGDEFTWWVRANNSQYGSGLWSTKGMFKAD